MSAQRKAQFPYDNLLLPPVSEDDLAKIDWLEAKTENLIRLRRQLGYPCRCASKPIK